MTIAEVVQKAPDVINVIGNTLLAVVIVATLVVRIIGAKDKESWIGAQAPKLIKLLHWLPTLGLNPQTKKLEDAYAELTAVVANVPPAVVAEAASKVDDVPKNAS